MLPLFIQIFLLSIIRMKNKLLIFIKLLFLAFFSFLWFVLCQAEYEMMTKPELQNEFPIIKGAYAVYFLGFILLIIGIIIVSSLPLVINLINSNFYKNMKKNWILGFLGFLGFLGVPGIFTQDCRDLLWLVWFVWFLYFIPQKKT